MPYIKQEYRDTLHERVPIDAGELNYTLTAVCLAYLKQHELRYQIINDILGAL